MPQSTNAPFNEFGQSMILRDIEDLYMLIGGTGTGSAGDGQTQDMAVGESQSVLQDKIGSPVVTEATAPRVIAARVPNPLPVNQGGTGAQTAAAALSNLGLTVPIPIASGGSGQATAILALHALSGNAAWSTSELHTSTYGSADSTGTFTVPAGVYRVLIYLIGAGSNNPAAAVQKFVAATSGGATTSTLDSSFAGCGAAVMAEIPVSPGDTIAWVAGAAANTSNGNNSSFTYSGTTITARGAANGQGGTVTHSGTAIPASWNVFGWCGAATANVQGVNGQAGGFWVNGSAFSSLGQGGAGSSGSQGAVAIFS